MFTKCGSLACSFAFLFASQIAFGQSPFQNRYCNQGVFSIARGCGQNKAFCYAMWCKGGTHGTPCAKSIELLPESKLDCSPGSVAQGDQMLGPRRELSNGVYQLVKPNWIHSLRPHASLRDTAEEILKRYNVVVSWLSVKWRSNVLR
jgi:hypothetical protein